MSASILGALGQQGQQVSTGYDAWGKVDLKDFITLLVTELQNQDPLEPMNNQEILEQISQIREIQSTQNLTETLESVLLGQNVITAGNMINQTIIGLSDDAERVAGQVERVSIEGGVARLHVGPHTVSLENVSEILPEGTDVSLEGESGAV